LAVEFPWCNIYTLSFQRKLESGPLTRHSRENGNPERLYIKTKYSYVYILASKRNGTLYVGVTADIVKRVYEHKNNLVDGFTKKYGVHMLVYYQQFEDIESAILEEKRLKNWRREWKLKLIEKDNADWKDLYEGLI
jgi:putative endonuclease